MACDIEIFFGDSATVTFTGSGTTADPIVATAAGGGSGGTAVRSVLTDNGNGTYTHNDGAGVLTVIQPVAAACTVAGGNGLTGVQNGAFVDGCTTAALAGRPPEEAGFDPAAFPEWWRQPFTGGLTGSEVWIVLADTNGDKDWHQVA